MFIQYLGGGIGHLKQFPPANNDNEVIYEYEDNEDEATDKDGETGNTGGDKGDKDDKEGDEGDEDIEVDPGESSDEDMGNLY